MPIASKLLQRYTEIISGPVVSDACISGECVSMLYETSWVKVMVVRYQVAPNIYSIEVEISFPDCVIEVVFPSPAAAQEQAHEYIESTVDHLKYLLKLKDAGFSLGILSLEGIWSAVLQIKGNPDVKLFEALLPPELV
jgi:hypothetical protein